MALAVETPAREDLSFRTNDDKRVGARWLKADAITPVVISDAALTLHLPPPPDPYPANPPIVVPPEELSITSTTPGDPQGWIEPTALAQGVVLVQIPHGLWATVVGRQGLWDLIATGEGMQRCLVRGVFVVEQGVST